MDSKPAFRSKWMDPDFRRDPKTACFCHVCQRDLKAGQAHRRILYELDRFEAVHADDWDAARVDIEARRPSPPAPLSRVVEGLVGMECAKRLGLEWSREA